MAITCDLKKSFKCRRIQIRKGIQQTAIENNKENEDDDWEGI